MLLQAKELLQLVTVDSKVKINLKKSKRKNNSIAKQSYEEDYIFYFLDKMLYLVITFLEDIHIISNNCFRISCKKHSSFNSTVVGFNFKSYSFLVK